MAIVEYFKNFLFELFPFLPRQCPISPGKYYGYNISIDSNFGTGINKFITPTIMPNGVYRNVFKFQPDNDTEGVTIWIHRNIYDVNNVENIMK